MKMTLHFPLSVIAEICNQQKFLKLFFKTSSVKLKSLYKFNKKEEILMLKIYNLKNKLEYLKEVAILEYNEWGSKAKSKKEFENKINLKVEKINQLFDHKYFCKLILVDDDKLVGFISIFPTDGDEKIDLSPWYATMYVKKEYRGHGYSKLLNNAILKEAAERDIQRLYLKTELENYYEKFGAKFLEYLLNGEKLYYIDL